MLSRINSCSDTLTVEALYSSSTVTKKYEVLDNHAYNRRNKTQIIFMDKNLIINSNFIGSQQTHRKKSLHQIDLQETIVLRIKKREEAI